MKTRANGIVKKRGGSHLHLVRPGAESLSCLRSLGLEKTFLIEDGPMEFPSLMRPLAEAEKPGADSILMAHKTLMEASEGARSAFGSVKEMLEKKLGMK